MVIKRNVVITPYHLSRTLHIYLPEGYEQHQEKRYPVLYMYDGHNLFDDADATYGKSWGMKEYLDSRRTQLIVVGVECNHEGNMRLCEYSPYDFSSRQWGDVRGTGKKTMDWMTGELIPKINRAYRTKRGRESTGIAGSSMGGLMAMWSVSRYNEFFSKAACLSSFVVTNAPKLQRDLRAPLQDPTRVYISWGGREAPSRASLASMAYRNLQCADILMESGAEVYLSQPPRGTHSEASWEKEIPAFMKFLFPGL